MQFMNVITWEPKERDAVLKTLAQALAAKPREGRKIVNIWLDIYNNRAFELIDIDNPGIPEMEFQVYRHFTNLMNAEHYGVIEFKQALKLIPEGKAD
ncbi:MAG: hypothetical protein HY530_02880 [Chloroflexi bacterium]|nr:hypothetical protein [Chloroflexota bacterium]